MSRFVRSAVLAFAAVAPLSLSAVAQFPVQSDASVNTAHASTNYGYLSNLYIGNGSTAYLRFDLSGLPSGLTATQISRATVTVFVNRVNAGGTVTVSQVTSGWSEAGITGATAPTVGGAVSSFAPSAAGQFVTFDVTALVQAWVTGPSTDNGIALSSGDASLLLDSKENDQTGHAAHLDITITSFGPAGPVGAQGPGGAAGPAGAQGPTGPQGASGPAGPQGLNGATGTISYLGAYSVATSYSKNAVVSDAAFLNSYVSLQDNNQGNPLPSSASTPTAFWATLAQQGATGAVGATGPQGVQGPVGFPGPVGAAGATGAQGPAGPQGPVGTVGATGAAGATGATGAQGPAGPQGPVGTVGATGATGATGAQGPAGPQGAVGITGATGATGAAGPVGPNGPIGPIGPSGPAGEVGPAGAQGAVGPAGPTGATGAQGAQGPAGQTNTSFTATTTGTNGTVAVNNAVRLDGGDQVTPNGISQTTGVVGVVTSLTGSTATVQTSGVVTANVDGAVTAGHFLKPSTSLNGYLTDAGITFPIDGSQVVGTALTGALGVGTVSAALAGPGLQAASSGGSSLPNGTAAGQIYLTGASPFAVQAPQTVTGDVTIGGTGVTAIANGAVTTSKMALHAVTTDVLDTSAVTGTNIAPATVTGDKIANLTVGVGNLNVTGTPSSSTYLRGDGVWGTPAGTGTTLTYTTTHTPLVTSVGLNLTNPTLGAAADAAGTLTYFPNACQIVTGGLRGISSVAGVSVTLRLGTLGGAFSASSLSLTCATANVECAVSGTLPIVIPAGSFADLSYSGGAIPTGVYTYFKCTEQ